MAPLLWLVTYVAMVFVGGSLLAPQVYSLAQVCADHFAWAQDLAAEPFHRYVSRSMQALALLGLYPFWRKLRIQRWRDLGLAKPIDGRELCAGFVVGLVSLSLVAVAGLAAGVRHWRPWGSAVQFLAMLGEAGLSAIGVALLEEVLFRGVLFGTLRKAVHWGVAWLASSSFYALVHFFQRPPTSSEIHWFSGMQTLGAMLSGVARWQTFLPGFGVLLLTGSVLCLAYQRKGTLYFSIGLHAGWVFLLRLHRFLVADQPGAASELWGSRKMVDGWVAFVVMSILVLLFWYWPSVKPAAQERPSSSGPEPACFRE